MPEINLTRDALGNLNCNLNNDAIDLSNDDYVALLQDAIHALQSELLTAELQA